MFKINYKERPVLNRPVIIMGFSGWPNAGEVSTGTIAYLRERLHARVLAHIEPAPFFDFTESRPTARILDGRVEKMTFPGLSFFYCKSQGGKSDLILFSGSEPHYNWQGFCFLVFQVAKHLGVEAIFTLGGTYDYIPHWAPPRISLTWSDEKARGLFQGIRDVEPAEYQGPVSIHTMLLTESREKGIPVAGLWGHAPVYIQTGNLKIHRAMIQMLKKVIDFSLDTTDLAEGIKKMDHQVEEMAAGNDELKQYLEDLKNEYGRIIPEDEPPAPTGQNGKVISLSDFMKRDKD